MKRIVILITLLALAAAAGMGQNIMVSNDYAVMQIKKPIRPEMDVTISLSPGQACTLQVIPFAQWGGYSLSYWDSLKQASNKDTAIVIFKLQGSNRPLYGFSAYGFTDSIAFTDTLINHSAGNYCERVYDMTSNIPRVNFLRGIATNAGPDTLQGLKIWQLLTVDR
ncbi:MAG: hypothetical protein RDU76_06230 [Candidatus Edwardsbacteria bacterium]|nr:hypothetical protein [Candidatus Edwardsbacteria bacterium]